MSNDGPWTIGLLLERCEGYFAQKGIETPRLEAEILLAHALETDRIHLYMEYQKVVETEERAQYRALVKRRASGEPTAYIVGSRAFWTLTLEVTSDVLIPRPETECVVEAALEHLVPPEAPSAIVDLGTGSGNIAIALAKERPKATILAVDISGPAVEVARRNAERCGVGDRVEVRQGDLFDPVRREGWNGRVDVIISNPPYVRPDERDTLPRDVRDFEPDGALFDRLGQDGLGMYRRILDEGVAYLRPRGVVVLELGVGLAGPVSELLEDFGYRRIAVRRDPAGIERVAVARPSQPPRVDSSAIDNR